MPNRADHHVSVRAPARLHMGFVDLHGGEGRRYGRSRTRSGGTVHPRAPEPQLRHCRRRAGRGARGALCHIAGRAFRPPGRGAHRRGRGHPAARRPGLRDAARPGGRRGHGEAVRSRPAHGRDRRRPRSGNPFRSRNRAVRPRRLRGRRWIGGRRRSAAGHRQAAVPLRMAPAARVRSWPPGATRGGGDREVRRAPRVSRDRCGGALPPGADVRPSRRGAGRPGCLRGRGRAHPGAGGRPLRGACRAAGSRVRG